MNNTHNDFFYCYDANLAHYLKFNKNISYITKAINPTSNKMFWMFWQGDDINKAIKEFFGVGKIGKNISLK